MPSKTLSIIIIGGGLAGLTSALHLAKKGMRILLIEKHPYPKHKVCGEYISNEVLPYLNTLGFDPFQYGATRISRLTLSTTQSRSVSVKLAGGGFGISRYLIDAELATLGIENGVEIIHSTVQDIRFKNDRFEVLTNLGQTFQSELVIGAFGKRSNLDVKMSRDFMGEPSPNLAVKAHYKGDFPADLVGLHNFMGGYCGISMVENNRINICYITDLKAFKKYKNIDDFQSEVLGSNRFLKHALGQLDMVFENPLTISHISFDQKKPVENHVLMCGDSAGMIHPLAGNGMSMAIRSAQMLSHIILKYKSGEIESRNALEKTYTRVWKNEFGSRLRWGRTLAFLFKLGIFSEVILILLRWFPFILPFVIRKTHGKPMKPEL